jgi:CRISPR/Cas system-associated endoribonuclease Cas2
MGKIEQEAKIIRRNTNIQKVILQSIATAGVLSIALLAPNALQLLQYSDGGKTRRQNPKYLIGSAFEKLCGKGLIRVEQAENGKQLCLTDQGKHALTRMVARSPDSRKHKRWDKRWRMVIYDIHEKRRSTRVMLREMLEAFGFYKLQHSVWVYPYECEELIILLKADFKIGSEVLYVVVEKIENDQKIRGHFDLK